jgi:hypothetical protein
VRLALAATTRATSVVAVLRDARGRRLALRRRASIGRSATLALRVPRRLHRGRYRVTVSALAGGLRVTASRRTRVR